MASSQTQITFYSELKETKQVKSASLDNVYSLKLVTDNPLIMDLGKLPPDTLLEVTIKIPS